MEPDSQGVNLTLAKGEYYTGSLYDIPLIGAVTWMAATALTAAPVEAGSRSRQADDNWGAMTLRLAMLAILSLPVLGLWVYRWDASPAQARTFRLFTVLAAMLVLGVFVFVRQYLQDQALIHLLEDSRRSFENEQRLQSHLVQREKLASLGQLVAGAAHEIDHPLTAIMEYSEKLWSNQRLTSEQDTLVRKIVNQSQRTRELIANLLSFAQQSSGEKTMVDLGTLLQRSVQMRELQRHDQKIRIETVIEPTCRECGVTAISCSRPSSRSWKTLWTRWKKRVEVCFRSAPSITREEVVVQFSDSGPGIKEPHRVFDPFYTTKPIGKGTGLGLSAVYGVVQDHRGQITCQNKPEGGAVFVLRLPVASQGDSQALAAVQS